jgi:hypothetical protein
MIDFQTFGGSLASVSIVLPMERTEGLNGRSEGGCPRRFSLATALMCYWTSLVVLQPQNRPPWLAAWPSGNPGGQGDDGYVDVFA